MEPNAPNPSGGPSPESGPSLPKPETAPNQAEVGQVEAAPKPAAPEVERPAGEGANQNQGMIIQTPQPVQATPQPVQTPVQDDDHKKAALGAPDLADDVDVIEKEWVDKAKQIVEATADDPHKKNHDVSILKADYMKKRYDKDIKLPEDKPAKV